MDLSLSICKRKLLVCESKMLFDVAEKSYMTSSSFDSLDHRPNSTKLDEIDARHKLSELLHSSLRTSFSTYSIESRSRTKETVVQKQIDSAKRRWEKERQNDSTVLKKKIEVNKSWPTILII